jgi:hypothetical protein
VVPIHPNDRIREDDPYEWDERHVKALQRNDYMELYLSNEAERNADYFNYDENLIEHHLLNGFTVSQHQLELTEFACKIKVALKEIRKVIKRARAEKVSKSANISEEEVNKICASLKKTSHVDRARVNEMMKFKTLAVYDIEPQVLDELDEAAQTEWFLKHGEAKTKAQYRNLCTLSAGFEKSIELVKRRELQSREAELLRLNDPERGPEGNMMDVAQSLSLINAKRLYPKWNIAVTWLMNLGIADMWDTTPRPAEQILIRATEIRDKAGDLDKLAHLLKKPKRRMKGFAVDAKDTHALQFMNDIFKTMFGIHLKGDRTSKNKKVEFYTLTAPKFNRTKDDERPWVPCIEPEDNAYKDEGESGGYPDSDDDSDVENPFL